MKLISSVAATEKAAFAAAAMVSAAWTLRRTHDGPAEKKQKKAAQKDGYEVLGEDA
jgi:hypothetical protein